MNSAACNGSGSARRWLVAIGAVLLSIGILAPAAQARTEEFESLAPTPVLLTSLAGDPDTGLVYAQENEGTKFFSYDPDANVWSELAPSPLNSGSNGGAAYLDGKIYLAYTHNAAQLAVYDVASDTWSTIANPLGEETGDITAGDGKLFLAVNRSFVEYDPVTETTTPLADPPAMESSCNSGFVSRGGLQFAGDKIYGHQGNGCRGFAVYDIASDTWTELPLVPLVSVGGPKGAVLGSAWNPVTQTYFAYGPYGGNTVYRFDAASGTWSTTTVSFARIDDGGMAYLAIPGREGIYMIQGEGGPEFARFFERPEADLSVSMAADAAGSADGGTIRYSIKVANAGPEEATGAALTDHLPAGTTLVSAMAGQGSCTGVSTVRCDLGELTAGASTSVTIDVTAPFGTFTNSVTASTESFDPNGSNDTARTVTTFAKLLQSTDPPKGTIGCRIPKKLRSRTLAGAKKALRAGHCRPGKLRRHHGDKIAKGRVIRGGKRPRGALPAGTKVNLIVSLGRRHH